MNFINFLIILAPIYCYGQFEEFIEKDPEPTTMIHGGGAFSIMETGFGLGAFYETPFLNDLHFGLSLDIIKIRDKDQIELTDPFTGYTYTFNKKNDVYLFNLMISAKKRLFSGSFDDSFRPYLIGLIGPVYGINYPEDENGKDLSNPHQWIIAGAIGVGLDADFQGGFYGGLRTQYRFMPFSKRIGERQDHSMIDIRFEIGQRF